jgi:AcrR family transcriptional regulator
MSTSVRSGDGKRGRERKLAKDRKPAKDRKLAKDQKLPRDRNLANDRKPAKDRVPRRSQPDGRPTRERIVGVSAELLAKQGYNATGVKQIVAAAEAPFGSLYHFFPGGKEQLGAEAIRVSGATYEQLIEAVFGPAPDPVTGVRMFFAGAAAHLEETNYADACPIATVALEISSTSEPMRIACSDVFQSWIGAGAERLERAGLSAERARELVIAMLAALEGAFVLARATRSTQPLLVAGEMAASAVADALPAD